MNSPKIEIWLYQDDASSLSKIIEGLPEPQREKALNFHSKRQRDYAIGRSMLALALRERSPSESWRIKERHGLGPIVEHSTRTFISNISHSQNWIALAIYEAQKDIDILLGLDIEVIKPDRHLAAARYFCNSAQLDELHAKRSAEEKSRYYSLLWTQKEAYFKAHQQSIWNSRLKSISFTRKLSRGLPNSEFVQSADCDQSLILSLCSDSAFQVNTKLIRSLDPQKPLPRERLKLNWQTFQAVSDGSVY